jgi:hypothetical protein
LTLLFAWLCCIGVGVVAYVAWPRTSSSINAENYSLLRPGMRHDEVEAILGGPARNECTGPIEVDMDEGDPRHDLDPAVWYVVTGGPWNRCQEWRSDVLLVSVCYEDGRVVELESLPVRRVYESPLDLIRRWFRW